LSEKRFKPLIVPIFIPNQGCPHRCVFCEQRKITSQFERSITGKYVEKIIGQAVNSDKFDVQRKPEIAFYGGTFTRLPFARMLELLRAAAHYLNKGLFYSIRVSTRPDAIDARCLDIMRGYGVRSVELGAQSMDNRVLSLTKRGHTAEDTTNSVQMLRDYGFHVGIQLMPGLPGDSEETFLSTIEKVIDLNPNMVRIYPALVIRGTELATWYKRGEYEPLGLDQAIRICVEGCKRLETNNIPVIRIGLMSSPSLVSKGEVLAGPWHPSFGHLVRSGLYRNNIESQLPKLGSASEIRVFVPSRDIPLIRGYKNQGLRWIERKTGANVLGIDTDDSLIQGRVRVEQV
jgi:histone acetyltransferase (RNA polymerase elongator complex component)